MRVVLGVTGGIACYKATDIVRRLKDNQHDVVVVPTQASLNFVGASTWEALSANPVSTDIFSQVDQVRHVNLAEQADLMLVAPATADFLARCTLGRADDLLSTVFLTATCPKLLFPAMHTQMWQNLATQENVATLRRRGVMVKQPASGRLTGASSGPGRFPDPNEIVDFVQSSLADPGFPTQCATQDLSGRTVLISAGGTREHLDPVRFIGNESSGRMGVALAQAAAARGANVILVAANLEIDLPSAINIVQVHTTNEMLEAMRSAQSEADLIIMAAAPADFTIDAQPTKIKKTGDDGLQLYLNQAPDILRHLVDHTQPSQTIVGFAAETANNDDELLALGQEKLAKKGADFLVLNNVSGGRIFGSASNSVAIIDHDGQVASAAGTKLSVANSIINAVIR